MKRKLIWAALGAVALLSSCAGLAGIKERTAEQTHPPLGRFVEVEGTRVHVWVEEGARTGADPRRGRQSAGFHL